MKKLNLIFALVLFGAISAFAQTDETKEKLENLKGDIAKITIETEDGSTVITGEDAVVLFKKMLAKQNIMIKKLRHGDTNKHKNMIFWKDKNDNGNIKIDVDVDINDSDSGKVIIIKKNIDGKELIEEYKGEEADKLLKNHSMGNGNMEFLSDDGELQIIMEMDSDELDWVSKGDSAEVMKKIEVNIEDGVKKVTVTTTENGEEKVEVYEGEKADNFLEKEHGYKMIFNSMDDNKKVIKKKIIIIEE
ncbi:MAG: hypothetical protein KKF62_08735, partial [Bacteroidetes bacterium]|nr:hypothetical protein [Bacteroidota bacterium]